MLQSFKSPKCTFHPVGPGWTEPRDDEVPHTFLPRGVGLVETLAPFAPHRAGLVETRAPFVPRRVGLVETRFSNKEAPFVPHRVGLVETRAPFVPRRVGLVETRFSNKGAPFAPRRAGLVETRFSSICAFHPVGPGWTEPKGDEVPCTICGAGLVETPFFAKVNCDIPPRKVRLWNLSKA
jgi:hypothetical protein